MLTVTPSSAWRPPVAGGAVAAPPPEVPAAQPGPAARPTPYDGPVVERNWQAALNIRVHVARLAVRTAVLVLCDVFAVLSLRWAVVGHGTFRVPGFGTVLRVGELPLLHADFGAALGLGLVVAGTYARGDRRFSVARLLAGAALATALPLWGPFWRAPVHTLAVFLLTATLTGGAVTLARLLLDVFVQRVAPRPLARTVLVGPAAVCDAYGERESLQQAHGFDVLGFVDPSGAAPDRALGSFDALPTVLAEQRADTVLLCGVINDAAFARAVRMASMRECQVLSASSKFEIGGVEPRVVWRRGQPFVALRAVGLRGQQLLVKRALDVMVALAMLLVAAPAMAVLAVLVRLDSPGAAVFGQRRLGRHGRPFHCYKFRSMYGDAEERLRRDPALRAEYVRNDYKLPADADPRITRVGRVLRRTSLDELPQLWNVLRGDMSLVGPRPIVPGEIRHYDADAHLLLLLKPGLTGLWQVGGRSGVVYPQRTAIELEYVQTWSLERDLRILARTVPAVLWARGAH